MIDLNALQILHQEYNLTKSDRGEISKFDLGMRNGNPFISIEISTLDDDIQKKFYSLSSQKSIKFFKKEMNHLGMKFHIWDDLEPLSKAIIGLKVKFKIVDSSIFLHIWDGEK